jgi:hypothetical protein
VTVEEEVRRAGRRGRTHRPFCARAGLGHRDYSAALQRVLADFGAEESFGRAAARVAEHYGVAVPVRALRQCTLHHARQSLGVVAPAAAPAPTLITQLDGSMIPIVEPAAAGDRRRGKTLRWQEARLAVARAADRAAARYGATLDAALGAGLLWQQTARGAGLTPASRVHGVGDGAPWIAEQFERQFGAQGRYLLDFYHVSQYLAAAAPVCAPGQAEPWRRRQQERLLAGASAEVIAELAAHREAAETVATDRGPEAPPVRRAHRYLWERRGQLDYAAARAAGLPIGSGEVEGGHRHIVQARLKVSGGWWRADHARSMLGLRTLRANGGWDRYWQNQSALN